MIFSVAQIVNYYWDHEGVYGETIECGEMILWKRNVFSRWRKTVKEGDDWMSNGRELQRTDAATGNERRPTVDRRKDGTRSDCDDDDRSRAKNVK